jgi:uncharacterized membrane protein (TIGR02234 family)
MAAVSGGWPWIALAAAALVVVGGATTIVRGRAWSGLSGRYDAPNAEDRAPGTGRAAPPGGSTGTVDEDVAWDALSRGEDPTK